MSRLQVFLLLLGVACCWEASPVGHTAYAQPLPDRAPLRGTIVDQDGKPLAKAYVTLRRQNSDGSYAFWGAETSTDEQGDFTFPGVEEGEYYLNSELGGYSSVLNRTVSQTRSPGPIRVQLTRLANTRFRFLASDGKPLANKRIWIRLRGINEENPNHLYVTSEQGTIVVANVVSAKYNLWAHSTEGYASQTLDLSYDPSSPVVDVTLQKGANIRVVARDSTEAGLGGASLILTPETADEAARLGSLSGDLNDDYAMLAAEGNRWSIVTRDGDGTLELENLPPGRYSARLVLPGYTTFAPRVVSLSAGKNEPLEWNFATRRVGSLTLDLRTIDNQIVAGEEVTVKVVPINTNGTIARESVDANGFAVPFFLSGSGARRVVTDATGRLRLYPLRPGRYRVFVARRQETSNGVPPKDSSPLDLDVGESGATGTVVLP